jgi:hypothetical protein
MSLGEALKGLITGGFGRTWVTNPTSVNDHWSEFINNVLSSADLNAANAKLQRIGEEVPRVQDILSFAANIPGLTHLVANNVFSYYNSESWLGFPYARENALDLIEKWRATLGVRGNSGKIAPPLKFDGQLSKPSGGMSFIYIVTFGDNSLDEVS